MSERLPCGCVVDVVGDAFVMEPCAPDCEYYQYALAESRRQGKPTHAVVDPELDADDDAIKTLLREAGFDA